MNSTDLRIGNWVSYRDSFDKISQLSNRVIHTEMYSSLEPFDIEAINLNDEWFLRLGFEKGSDIMGDCWFVENATYDLDFAIHTKDGGFVWRVTDLRIKHVHHLQNLFYSLHYFDLEYNINYNK